MEHLQHFGLSQDPFQNEPDLRFYFESASHREAQLRVERGLRQNKGLTLLTGDSGSGKTLVTRRIFDGLEEEMFEVSLMVILPGAADAGSVILRFARQLGIEEPSTDRSELLGQIYEMLAIVREDGRHSLLILDDAQMLERDSIAEIGGLLNLEYEERRLLSMLWVGTPTLDVTLSHDPSLCQRVDVRATLQPLDLANSIAYIRHRLEVARGNPDIITSEGMEALFKFGRGRPRLLNTLADNGLFETYLAGRSQLAASDVERAAAELGIGSDPGSTYSGLPQSLGAVVSQGPIVGSYTDTGSGSTQPRDPFDIDGADAGGNDKTTLLGMDTSPSAGAVADLDAGVEAALADAAASGPLAPEFGEAEATRVAFLDDELSVPGNGSSAQVMDLDASLMPDDVAPTRVSFDDDSFDSLDILDAEEAPIAAAPVAGEDEQIDDLFVELLDE